MDDDDETYDVETFKYELKKFVNRFDLKNRDDRLNMFEKYMDLNIETNDLSDLKDRLVFIL